MDEVLVSALSDVNILQAVPLASRSGKFGGPFDTSVRQAQIMSGATGRPTALLAGHLTGDEPLAWPAEVTYVGSRVRRRVPTPGFTGFMSVGFLRAAWRSLGQADLVHLSVSRELMSVATLALALVRRTRVVAQTHGMLTSRTSLFHRTFDLALRPLLRRAEVVIALTDVEARQIASWMGDAGPPIEVLGNPLLDPGGAPSASGAVAASEAVFIARLHPRKRVLDFARAAEIARSRGWSEHYVVVGPDEGDGPLVSEIVAASKANLRYDGPVPVAEVPAVLTRSRVFVLCSTDEPWGNVLAQAMALGVPVVVTESAALASAVVRFGAGIVVPDLDPEALADAVHRIVEDDDLTARLGAGGLAFARDVMGETQQLERLSAIYRSALTDQT